MSRNNFAIGMLFVLVAVSVLRQSPTKNIAAQKSAAEAPAARGKKVFDAQCEICHYTASTKKKLGPGLKGLCKRGTFANGKKVDEESLRRWIESGGKDMPSFKDTLNATEIRDLIAYLKTL